MDSRLLAPALVPVERNSPRSGAHEPKNGALSTTYYSFVGPDGRRIPSRGDSTPYGKGRAREVPAFAVHAGADLIRPQSVRGTPESCRIEPALSGAEWPARTDWEGSLDRRNRVPIAARSTENPARASFLPVGATVHGHLWYLTLLTMLVRTGTVMSETLPVWISRRHLAGQGDHNYAGQAHGLATI